jgi:hypothetical protein
LTLDHGHACSLSKGALSLPTLLGPIPKCERQREAAPTGCDGGAKLRVVVKSFAAGWALAQVDGREAGIAQLRHVVLDRPVMPDGSGAQPLLVARTRHEVVVHDPVLTWLRRDLPSVMRRDDRVHNREHDAAGWGEARATRAKDSAEIPDVVQRHQRQHQVERISRFIKVLDIAQERFSRRALERSSRSLDHPRRPINAPIAHSTRVQQLASNLGIAAAEVEHPQSHRRAQLVKERRALHSDVRIERPRTVLLVSLEQLRVVVERAAPPITGICDPRPRRATHSETRRLPPPSHSQWSAAKAG